MRMSSRKATVIADRLADYFLEHGRDYPWRKDRTPFRVYVSEVLLQRTRADQVKPVFERLMAKYPDAVSMLSNFSDVAVETKTLGRFLRLRFFRAGLEYIVSNHSGNLPGEKEKLLQIPGVGGYIAAAIRIFGFDIPDTIVDANVVRVLGRLYGLEYNGETRRKREFIELAEEHSLHGRCAEYSYGILDFAAAICKPKRPVCAKCFLAAYCDFFRQR